MAKEYIELDKSLETSLHDQIRTCVSKAISNGTLKDGDRLPTEEELCSRFSISRSVVQQAYSTLCKEGYIVRLRRRGTFVAPTHRRGIFIDHQFSFEREMKTKHKNPRTECIVSEVIPCDELQAADLRIEPGDRCLHLQRMRYANDIPYQWVENYVVLKYFPGLEYHHFDQESLYMVLGTQYSLKIDHAQRSFSAAAANETLAPLIGQSVGTPLLQVDSRVFDQYMRVFERSKVLYAPDSGSYEFDVYDTLDYV